MCGSVTSDALRGRQKCSCQIGSRLAKSSSPSLRPGDAPTPASPVTLSDSVALSQDGYASSMANHRATPQDLETTQPYLASAAGEPDHPHHHQHHQPPPPPQHRANNHHHHPHQPAAPHTEKPPEEGRNSSTPVVSLLSIDHQQEKDYLSLQGGRRRKASAPAAAAPGAAAHVHHVYPSNGYVNALNSYAVSYAPPYGFGHWRSNNGFAPRGKRKAYERRVDHSSRSSLRTDSNSSASYADENKNESRTPPPPAPYSPMAQQYKIIGNTRNFHNTARYNSYRQPFTYNNNNNNNNEKGRTVSGGNGVVAAPSANCDVAAPPTNCGVAASPANCGSTTHQSVVSQVHVNAGAAQGFAPQARRSRRSIRRSGAAGVSEIGAGDAPLPNEEVCKKFETLKL